MKVTLLNSLGGELKAPKAELVRITCCLDHEWSGWVWRVRWSCGRC